VALSHVRADPQGPPAPMLPRRLSVQPRRDPGKCRRRWRSAQLEDRRWIALPDNSDTGAGELVWFLGPVSVTGSLGKWGKSLWFLGRQLPSATIYPGSS
jgi:hypothetical protein